MRTRIITIFIALLLLTCWTGAIYADDAAENAEVIYSTAESPDALSGRAPGNTWPVTIDPASGDVTCESGEDLSLPEALGISEKKADKLTSGTEGENREEISAYLEGQGIYDTKETKDGQIQVSFPYAYQELLVFLEAGELKNSHGASSAVYYELTKCYVLRYDSPQAAKEARDALAEELGEEKVMVNLPAHAADYSQVNTNYTSAVSVSWGVDRMGLDTLRDKANRSSIKNRVLVAVLDTGINRSHEMFSGRTLSPLSKTFTYQTASKGYEYYDDAASYSGHGTHVAGTIADGTSKQIDLLILKIFNCYGEGSLIDILAGFQEAYNCGADIANFSGAITFSKVLTASDKKELRGYLKEYWNGGMLVVCSSGNESLNIDSTLYFPASMGYNASVSATELGDTAALEFTNFGTAVDFAAPGVDIVSANAATSAGYKEMDGTSMAAPHISAAAAMLKLYNPKATPAELFAMLKAVSYLKAGTSSRYLGYGVPLFRNGIAPLLLRTQKITLSKSSYVYNGKARKPAVTVKHGSTRLTAGKHYTVSYSKNKKAGKATVSIKGKGYYVGTVRKTFTIHPKGTSLKKLKKGRKQLTVVWKKQKTQTSGYQILLATNSKFTKGKKKVTISGSSKNKKVVKGLKAKKLYYVKIRTFKKVSGKKIWSSWSKVKKQKTK